jgi:hypothetical protein
MTRRLRSPERRAELLVRWYSPAWRARYADEFTLLLLDDISERPRSWRRTADVVRGGALTRLADCGLTDDARAPERQLRAGLAGLGFALAGFLVVGVAIWSQLTIGWQWSAPSAAATTVAMLVMSGAVVVFLGLAMLAALPIAWTLGRAVVRREAPGLVRPLLTALAGATVLIVGSHHFGQGWPGTGGHPWSHSGLVPGSLAAFSWASTLWVTSYWAHPAALAAFPATEVAWMAASPLALLALIVGASRTLRQLRPSPRVLAYEARLALAAVLAMAGFLAGAGSWVLTGGPAPRGLFRVGAIDELGIAAMAAALVLAFRSVDRALSASKVCRAGR